MYVNNGFQIQAVLPKSLPPDDRIKVIDWFHNYRNQVRNEHPMWTTLFRSHDDRMYSLYIIPTETPKQQIAQAVTAFPMWEQLSLDYAER